MGAENGQRGPGRLTRNAKKQLDLKNKKKDEANFPFWVDHASNQTKSPQYYPFEHCK